MFSGCFQGIFREGVFSLCPFRVCPLDPSNRIFLEFYLSFYILLDFSYPRGALLGGCHVGSSTNPLLRIHACDIVNHFFNTEQVDTEGLGRPLFRDTKSMGMAMFKRTFARTIPDSLRAPHVKMWGFEAKRARKFTRTSPRTLPWNFITMLSAPLTSG